MQFKYSLLFVTFFTFTLGHAQREIPFGKISTEEREFITYEKDSTANAVVMYEKGNNFFAIIADRIRLVKEYRVKIKILKQEGYRHGTINIPYYHNDKVTETVKNIKAVTHNGGAQTYLAAKDIFDSDITDRWSEKKFTLPNIKVGSILEYTYRIESPFIFNFNGWYFQSDIPKMYSEFNAKIPANYKYNRTLTGTLQLAVNNATIKKACFDVPGYNNPADCEVLKYVMKDIPAFKTEEDYMLAASNYISHLDFEMSELHNLDGTRERYTKTWKDVDHEFKTDRDIGRQLTKKGFFEKNVPLALFDNKDPFIKAKNIYAFVKGHYNWNGKYSIYTNNSVKEAFENKSGNVGEINMSLINLLNAANVKTNLVLLSTRKNGLPKQNHPVMSDFNYIVAKVEIDGKDYLLDATDKFMPFGMLPFRCLNYYGRVMDFKNESSWYDIKAYAKNQVITAIKLDFDETTGKGFGIISETRLGYDALSRRKTIAAVSEEEYLTKKEELLGDAFVLNTYKFQTSKSSDEKTLERFEFEIADLLDQETIYLNPFLIKFFRENPFVLSERNYPIDFGYQRAYKYRMTIAVPKNYEITQIPKQKAISLPENSGRLIFSCTQQQNQIALNFNLSLNRTQYPAPFYEGLKQLFNEVVEVQKNSIIVLKKK